MTAFPDNLLPAEWGIVPAFETLRFQSKTGKEFARRKRSYPLHKITLDYRFTKNWSGTGKMREFLDFFTARGGAYEAFTFFDPSEKDSSPVGLTWAGIYFAVAPSGTTAVDLPFKNGTSVTVYQAGVSKAGSLAAGTGTDGRDKFTPTSPWTAGQALTVDFTGRRAFNVKGPDEPVFGQRPGAIFSMQPITLLEVL